MTQNQDEPWASPGLSEGRPPDRASPAEPCRADLGGAPRPGAHRPLVIVLKSQPICASNTWDACARRALGSCPELCVAGLPEERTEMPALRVRGGAGLRGTSSVESGVCPRTAEP